MNCFVLVMKSPFFFLILERLKNPDVDRFDWFWSWLGCCDQRVPSSSLG
ncbi:hypothetical protein SynNOUM97013_01112 [Synechococcus sp. NOUM97013]|nr:hypothetical protein SynNOUM97013_01112 [Synechococcus sp. NOUM97013]